MIEPARENPEVELAAVGARELATAQTFAADHGIVTAYGSYDELVADRSLDAIYVSNPASLHAEWTIKSLEAGHHVLCEKPLAGNAADAEQMVESAAETDRVLIEALHWRFHPIAQVMVDHVAMLEGPVAVESVFNIPQIPRTDIRYRYELGGGALMDLGCYPVHWIRTVLGEPTTVSAEMDTSVGQIDDTVRACLEFADGSTASLTSSMAAEQLEWWLTATAANGSVRVDNPVAPHQGNKVAWNINDESGVFEVNGPTTYASQLDSFAATVAGEIEPVVTGSDSINNMRTIDRMYLAAGLRLRP